MNFLYERETETENNIKIKKSYYRNESCAGCQYRESCHKSKYDQRTIKVSHRFLSERRESFANITTEKGILLRVNRSIQVEGAFGVIKEDYGFRRFLTRGKPKTETQFFLISFAHNIKKYFNKRNGKRLKTELFDIKSA